jgi:hypothetical protein
MEYVINPGGSLSSGDPDKGIQSLSWFLYRSLVPLATMTFERAAMPRDYS